MNACITLFLPPPPQDIAYKVKSAPFTFFVVLVLLLDILINVPNRLLHTHIAPQSQSPYYLSWLLSIGKQGKRVN